MKTSVYRLVLTGITSSLSLFYKNEDVRIRSDFDRMTRLSAKFSWHINASVSGRSPVRSVFDRIDRIDRMTESSVSCSWHASDVSFPCRFFLQGVTSYACQISSSFRSPSGLFSRAPIGGSNYEPPSRFQET
jgi:hypothetical protein